MTLYYFTQTKNPLIYDVGKFNDDLELLETYQIGLAPLDSEYKKPACTCPSYKYPCKHINMLQQYLRINFRPGCTYYYDDTRVSWIEVPPDTSAIEEVMK